MADPGLRERKKQKTREHIATTAAGLFAARGYEHVAVIDVARAAEVSEQTVYNYFPTKEQLVVDREPVLLARLPELIRNRPAGTSPAAALREEALALAEEVATLPSEEVHGGLGHLAALSPAVRRLSLEMTDRLADAIAAALAQAPDPPRPQVAKLQGIALASVFQTITDQTGQRLLAGHDQRRIAADLRPIVEDLIASLDQWLSGA